MVSHAVQCLSIKNLDSLKTDHQSLMKNFKKCLQKPWSNQKDLVTFASRSRGMGGLIFEVMGGNF